MREAEQSGLLGGRYRLGSCLGSGGMADVYRATDTRLERVVAVKAFRSGIDASGRARFEEEARLLAGLHHPGLVPVYDASASDGDLFLVMHLVDGHTLADELDHGPLPPEHVVALGRQLADVLAYVHDNGIVHRDVKPSNVLVSRSGQAFLADFGISRLADAVASLTGSGIIGTAAYMAPEQVRGQEVGFPADVYALGLVLLQCATGRVEYPGTGIETAVARLNRAPHVPEQLPERLAGALQAMTADDPRERPSAAQCAEWFGGHGSVPLRTSAPTEVADPPTAPGTQLYPADETFDGIDTVRSGRSRAWRWWTGVGGAAVLAVIAVLLFLSTQTPEPVRPGLPPAAGAPGVERLPQDLSNLERLVRG
jgi:serine/threonine protein kinase